MSLDDLKYKLGDLGTNLRYKLDDIKANPKAKVWLIGGGLGVVLLLIFVVYSVPRLMPNRPGSGRSTEIKSFRGPEQDWITKARAALASDPKYAAVTIEEGADEGGGKIIVIRGPMMDMPERLALGSKFRDIGQPKNLVYQLGEPQGP